jgi:hypothetical protein
MRGIPAGYDKEQVEQMLQHGLRIDNQRNGVEIRSLAEDPMAEGKISTITFQREPRCISLIGTEWEFNSPSIGVPPSMHEYSQYQTRRMPRFRLDTHFRGITAIASFTNPSDHKFE